VKQEEQLEIREDDLSGSQALELLRLHGEVFGNYARSDFNQFLHLPL
jgi:hypothetical protein